MCFCQCLIFTSGPGFAIYQCSGHSLSRFLCFFSVQKWDLYRYIFSNCCWSVAFPFFLLSISSPIILCVIALLLNGRKLSVEKTTALPGTFWALLLGFVGVCAWLGFYGLYLLVVSPGFDIWILSQGNDFNFGLLAPETCSRCAVLGGLSVWPDG